MLVELVAIVLFTSGCLQAELEAVADASGDGALAKGPRPRQTRKAHLGRRGLCTYSTDCPLSDMVRQLTDETSLASPRQLFDDPEEGKQLPPPSSREIKPSNNPAAVQGRD